MDALSSKGQFGEIHHRLEQVRVQPAEFGIHENDGFGHICRPSSSVILALALFLAAYWAVGCEMRHTRRFPPPWHADKTPGGYIVRDANGQALAYLWHAAQVSRLLKRLAG
jgi:hypothetical protein